MRTHKATPSAAVAPRTRRKRAATQNSGLRTQDSKAWPALKKQSIQDAVIRILSREGLGALTMERIAAETGIAKGTVYLHYRDKQELLEAVKDAALSPLMQSLADILRSDRSPEERLREYSRHYLAYFDARRSLFRVLLYERETTRVQAARFQSDRYRELVTNVAEVLREGIRDGAFRDVCVTKLATMFVESNIAVMNQRLVQDDDTSVEHDAELISELYLRGLHDVREPRTSSRRSR